MCTQWNLNVQYAVVITRQSNPPISQFNSPRNEITCLVNENTWFYSAEDKTATTFV